MNDILPEAVRKGLEEARMAALRRSHRLRIHDGDIVRRVLRLWDGGFSLAAEDAPRLRGFVDLFDGGRHLAQCLVVASREEEGEMIYEFKWQTPVADRPALDFPQPEGGPVALIPR